MKSVSAFCLLLLFIAGAIPAGAAPALVYSTAMGGGAVDVAVDSAGNAIVLGYGGDYDYFLAKLSPRGELIFRRPIELPSQPEVIGRDLSAVALDPAGYIYIAGAVRYDACFGYGKYECTANDSFFGFVAKLGPEGTGIFYDSIYWEAHRSPAQDLAVDALGRAHALFKVTWREYDHPYWDGIRFSPTGSIVSYFGYPSDLYWSEGSVAMAMGPSGDLFTAGWGFEDYEGSFPAAYLQRRDASSGAETTTSLGSNEMLDHWGYLDVAGTPGGGSVVVAKKSGGLYVAELSRTGEKIFSQVLNLATVEAFDVAVTSFGQIVLLVNTGPSSLLLWLEGGTGEVISSTSLGGRVHAGALAAGPWGDVYMARNGYVSRYTENRPPDCSRSTASPSVIWPPNGKMIPVAILGVTDPEGDPVALKVTGISQDEPGAAFSGIGSSAAQVKAERDGKGDGRVYRIGFQATDPFGGSCTGQVTVCVPHDQGKGSCVDSGTPVSSSR